MPAAVIAVGLVRLHEAQANLDLLSTSGIGSVQATGSLRSDFLQARSDVLNLALVPDPAGTATAHPVLTPTVWKCGTS